MKQKVLCGMLLAASFSGILSGQQCFAAPAMSEKTQTEQTVHDEAIALSRAGNHRAALNVISKVANLPNTPTEVLFDYVVLAAWAEEYELAVQVYETRILPLRVSLPNYVADGVASSYFKLKKFKEARQIYHSMVAEGNSHAMRWEAECLGQMGEAEQALKLYNDALKLKPDDSELYAGRALIYIKYNDSVKAMKDAETAIKLTGDDPISGRANSIRAEVGGTFIQHEDYYYAIMLLKPAVEAGKATMTMQCDYISALVTYGDYAVAIATAEKIWPQLDKIPMYGRRSLADAYLRAKQPEKASKIYQKLVGEKDFRISDRQSMAFAYLMSGKTKPGLAIYEDIITHEPHKAYLVLSDSEMLLNMGRYHNAHRLYDLLTTKQPGHRILKQRFSEGLMTNDLYREAWQQYVKVFDYPDGRMSGATGIVRAATHTGDYHAARSALNVLQQEYPQEPSTAHALSIFQHRHKGDLAGGYVYTHDYKGNTMIHRYLGSEQKVGDRITFMTDFANRRVSDQDTTSRMKTASFGLRYVDMRRIVEVWGEKNSGYSLGSGGRTSYRHYFGEDNALGFYYGKHPVYDAQAMTAGVMNSSKLIEWSRQIGQRDHYTISVGRDAYSDSNSVRSFNLSWDHIMVDEDKREVDWFVYAGQTSFAKQLINALPTTYESPGKREVYGGGIRHRWIGKKGYFEAIFNGEIGRDRPEPFDWTPHMRLEYGYSPNTAGLLTIGAEYGARTGRSTGTGTGLQFGYRQYDIMYHLSW